MRMMVVARIFIAALTVIATAGSAQELTQAEKERALTYLESTKVKVVQATKGLTEAQWNFKAGPDRWSVAQVMEHIAASDDFIRDNLIKDKVMVARAGEPGRDVKKIDEEVITNVPDRSHKAQAPEPLQPNNRFGSPEGSVNHFLESRAVTERYVKETPGLRDHVMDGPIPKMDGYEYILMIAAHTDRHVKQIEEVKADPKFPKN